MSTIKYILVLMSGIFLCLPADAQRQRGSSQRRTSSSQQTAGITAGRHNRVQYRQNYMKHIGDSLVVDMDIDMSNLKLRTNHAQILTPVIISSTEEIELPAVMIQGSARNRAFMRNLELNDHAYAEFERNPPYAIVKPKGYVHYRVSLPYELWMDEAALDVEEDLCGCGDQTKIAQTRVFDGLTQDAEPEYRVRFRLAYIQPEVETVKRRQEIGNAYLDFPRGKNEILPGYGNNYSELAKIDNMIRSVSTNKDISVRNISMTGYASPESSLEFNTALSRARAKSMMNYFMNNSNLDRGLFETRTGSEDWEGLRKLLEDYPLSNKNEILYIMNNISDLDQREKAISKVGGGRPYKIMYEELYPKLRRVVCEIQYTVKDFSLEEAKANIRTAPQLLSLNEMYLVANTYEAGSSEFLKVFETAREEFPNDPVANLNGAAAALSRNNLRDAQKYLQLADPSTTEYANNMGVYQMLRGNFSEAEELFKRAQREGLDGALFNLKELNKKAANVKNRREAGADADGGGTRRKRYTQSNE